MYSEYRTKRTGSGPEIYLDLISQPCRAVWLFAKVNNIRFIEKHVSLSKHEQKKTEFKKISPLGKVPVIKEGDFILTESEAILKYLAEKPGVPDHWHPADPKKRARVDEFLSWHHTGLRTKLVDVFIEQAVKPFVSGKPADVEAVQAKIPDAYKALDTMEDYFLAHTSYLAGNDITIADLMGVCEMMQLAPLGYNLVQHRPKLAAWLTRVKQTLGPLFDQALVSPNKLFGPFKLPGIGGVDLYYDLLSQPSRATWLFVKANKIPFNGHVVSLSEGAHHKPEYKKIHPLGQVPCLQDGDFTLTESEAILKYLSAKPGVADHWHPADPKKRARVDEFMSWHHVELRKKFVDVYHPQVILPLVTKQPVDKKAVEEKWPDMNKALDTLENYYLKESKYLAGDEISLADLTGACECMQVVPLGYDVTENRPKVKAWMERLKGDLGNDFQEAHKSVFDFFPKFKL